ATDVNGAQASYSYNGTGGCNSVLVTGITEPLGLSRSFQWNCNLGKVMQVADENGQPTTYSYTDPLLRQTNVTDPIGNITNISYSDIANSFSFASSMSFNSNASVDKPGIDVDGLGRVLDSSVYNATTA